MVKNENGFSLVELLAIIVITSVIIVPLMQSMIGNIRLNNMMHDRRSATSVADGALYGFDKLDYSDLELILDNANTVDFDYNTEFNLTNCDSLLSSTDDQAMCTALFESIFTNVSFDSTHFRIFIYDYNLSTVRYNALIANTSIPQEVRDHIQDNITASTDPYPGLIRISVWIQFSDDPVQTVLLSGLLIGDWSGN
jgi:type II secretory pathway pseudopilin PulG